MGEGRRDWVEADRKPRNPRLVQYWKSRFENGRMPGVEAGISTRIIGGGQEAITFTALSWKNTSYNHFNE